MYLCVSVFDTQKNIYKYVYTLKTGKYRYLKAKVEHFSHYTMRTPLWYICIYVYIYIIAYKYIYISTAAATAAVAAAAVAAAYADSMHLLTSLAVYSY